MKRSSLELFRANHVLLGLAASILSICYIALDVEDFSIQTVLIALVVMSIAVGILRMFVQKKIDFTVIIYIFFFAFLFTFISYVVIFFLILAFGSGFVS